MKDNQNTRTVSLQTVGCRLNQYETEKMAADLRPFGFRRVARGEVADLYIINTCTVTHRADSDCRYLIRRAARANPAAKIVVAGCFVDKDPSAVEGMEPVDVIIQNSEKSSVSSILAQRLPDLFSRSRDNSCSTDLTDFYAHNRAWIKISDGCNQRCSFCILPTVRGRLVHRSAVEIIDEINSLVEHGYEEVVMTGVNVGYYRDSDAGGTTSNLAALCRLIIDETDLKRLRMSSIEPQMVTDELLDLYGASRGRICRHWHIPLQSGSPRILKMMRRPYNIETYLDRIKKARAAAPNAILGADVIVGFPGENVDDFSDSEEVARSGLLDYLHVFSYSDRPGTDSSQLPEKVPPELIKERNVKLSRLSDELLKKAYQRQVGETLDVISEHRKSAGGTLWGVADNFVKVRMPDWYQSSRKTVKVKVESASPEGVEGDLIEE